ncbi:MAG: hypothetical protein UU38_C0010G0003 [Candidatus Wolfebacteria bacterium GW2011_GWB1_41_12]|uniref:Uncharacterized protein n=2 Tax=Parcubacteria group TaxID=1794811 RepID=A0A0G0WV20_9BACT|nr:MAG: hypothetical protein UU38_C0010G0003 [Candidatus Wolfebacteria bacterium GW2011_GWB1_41_12]KKT58453.1 MAG: hypothetical protein UW53_C0033G0003 [Candidatus Giovannonibacteria bacterium GW2011_GWA1_44_25]
MKKIILPKKQKSVFTIPGIIVIAAIIVIIAAVVILGQRQPKGEKIPISPSQLMPSVSAAQARKTICNLKKEALFAQACQSKFDIVGKEDVKKIAELFVLLDQIQNDKSISDYERLLLAQAVFAVLPTKDSHAANLYQPALFSRLKDYLKSKNIVHAQKKAMSEEEFKKQMERDLQNVVGNLPKGDNAWVINIMVSKYSWIDGKSRPLYSHQFLEVFDPFPNNPNVNTRDISYHVRSIVGSKSSSQTVNVGSPEYKGTSDMMAYSFSIVSWNSQEYTGKDGPIEEEFLVKKNNFSDSFYQGEYYLTNLLDAVKMPSTKRPIERSDKKEPGIDSQTNTPREITCEKWKRLAGSKDCRQWAFYEKKGSGLWCADTTEELYRFTDYGMEPLFESRPPDYTYSFDPETCIITKEDYERNR